MSSYIQYYVSLAAPWLLVTQQSVHVRCRHHSGSGGAFCATYKPRLADAGPSAALWVEEVVKMSSASCHSVCLKQAGIVMMTSEMVHFKKERMTMNSVSSRTSFPWERVNDDFLSRVASIEALCTKMDIKLLGEHISLSLCIMPSKTSLATISGKPALV